MQAATLSGRVTVNDAVYTRPFSSNGGLLDLTDPLNRNTSHNASNITLGIKVMDNFANATSVK